MPGPERPLRVLLLEDNAAHAELVRRSFESTAIAIDLVHLPDGEAGLDYLLGRGRFEEPAARPCPDLVLLDLRMPRMGGLEVLERIRARSELNGLPVVILSTSDADADVTRAQDLHANGYVVKPSDFADFQALVRDLAGYWLRWHHSRGPNGR